MLEVELESPTTLEVEMDREVVRSNIKIDGEAVDKGFLKYKASNGAYETVLPDAEVNSTSENIVQNKAVHDYVESRISDVEGEIPDVSEFVTKDVDDLTNYTDNTTLASTYATKGEIPDTSNFITKDVDNLTNYTTTSDLERDYASKDYVETYGGKIDEIEFNGTTQEIVNKKVSMSETDPTVPSWAKQSTKPTYTYSEVGALSDGTKYGASIDMSINSTTYVITIQLKDQDGNNLGQAKTVDLPLESIVVSAQYYATYTYDGTTYTKVIVITLATTSVPVIVPVGDLVSGLQTEITSSNKLSADLIADGETNKVFTATEKSKLSGIESGAEANVQPDWNQTNSTQDDYIKNKPTIPVDTNQKIKTSTVTFGNDDVVEIEAGQNVTVVGDETNKKITISATSGSNITITTTTGSESISDGTNTLNVMTRDTDQTITGAKTHTADFGVQTTTTIEGNTYTGVNMVNYAQQILGAEFEEIENNVTTNTASYCGVASGVPGMEYSQTITDANENTTQISHSVTADADGVKIDGEVVPTTYQKKTDNTLNTTSKTIVGAINELYGNFVNANTTLESILGV